MDQTDERPTPVEAYAPQSEPLQPVVGRKLLIGTALAIIIALLAGGAYLLFGAFKSETPISVSEDIIRIGLSLDTVKIQRWSEERDRMISRAQELGATVTVFSAENDSDVQTSQIQNLISQNVDVIIVVAHDAASIGPVLDEAQQAGIKVINYDRLTTNSTPDLYLSFDSEKVGEYAAQYVIDAVSEAHTVPNIAYVGGSPTDNNAYLVQNGAMRVLDPLIQEGKINLVYSEFTVDWNPSAAYTNIKQFIADGGTIHGAVVANDGMAYGVIQALSEQGLAGQVPVSGQDGELQALQRIVQGTQTVSLWKPGYLLADKAINDAVLLAKGSVPETNSTVNNGTIDVQSYLFDPVPVTAENLQETIVASGVYTAQQLGLGQQTDIE